MATSLNQLIKRDASFCSRAETLQLLTEVMQRQLRVVTEQSVESP